MNQPDAPGQWAFEGTLGPLYFNKKYDGEEIFRFIREVCWSEQEGCLVVLSFHNMAPLKTSYFNGRWQRIIPFWETGYLERLIQPEQTVGEVIEF